MSTPDGKKSFIFYSDWEENLSMLTLEEKGKLLDAILGYVNRNELPGDDVDKTVLMAFSFMRKSIDRDREKWEKTVEKRREAGKMGGRPKGSSEKQTKAKKANGFSEKQTKAKKAVSDSVSVSVSVSDSESVGINPHIPAPAQDAAGTDEDRVQFAEHVTMTNAEHQKLLNTHGPANTKLLIEILDDYKGAHLDKHYDSDYRAICSWCVDKLNERKATEMRLGHNNRSGGAGSDSFAALAAEIEKEGTNWT